MTLRHKVLVIDDEPHIRRLLHTALTRGDYAIAEAADGKEALAKLGSENPDVTLLDLGLPDRDGLELVPLIKKQSQTTLIVISAREATEEKVAALDLGADDYLTKPFDTDELLARIRVAMRNRMTKDGGVSSVRAGDVEIDLMMRQVRKGGEEVHLTPKEYSVLAQLAQFPGRVITHKQIMNTVWPRELEHHVEYLRVLVKGLRQKLETEPQHPQIIVNELGVGYRLRPNSD
ncbi:MAG: response regulator [Sphingobium phenoxybenzoativorans]